MKLSSNTDLGIADDLTHLGSERPVLQQQSGNRRKWHAEKRHENVTHSKVDNVVISDGPHMRTRLYYVAYKAVTSQRKQEDETVHYVHCGLIVRGCVNTAWSVVAGKVESGVIPVTVIEAGVHGVSSFTTPFACMYKSTVSQYEPSKHPSK